MFYRNLAVLFGQHPLHFAHNGALIRKYLSVFEDFYRKNAQINDFGNVISENYV